ncbi:hypothetical protein [Pseudomonas phage vB_PaeP_PS28]|nr:hypothetical protein [Pseudomonas phage vB_PaeP_PS28]
MKNQRITPIRRATVHTIACVCWGRGFNYDMCKYMLIRHGFSPVQSMDDFQLFWNQIDQEYADYCNKHNGPGDSEGFADVWRNQ